MWKIILFISIAITSIYAADLYCSQFNATTGECSYVDYITHVTSATEVINVVGQPSTYVDAVSLNVYLSGTSQLDYVPINLFKIFTKLQSITFQNNSLSNLGPDSFDYCSTLTSISFSYETFKNLPAGFAQKCVKLEQIYIMWGEITSIDADALKGLSALKYFMVMFSKLECIPPALFANTPKLESVSFMDNKITAVDPMTFEGLPHLISLDLSKNLLKNIPNFSLTKTATQAQSNTFSFNCLTNPIQAIDSQFIPTLFSARAKIAGSYTYASFSSETPGNCLPNMNTINIQSNDYNTSSSALSTCYSNWQPSLVVPVSCAPTTTTTSTSTTAAPTTTTQNSLTTGGTAPQAQCCQNGVLQVILGAFRNMTFNVAFNL